MDVLDVREAAIEAVNYCRLKQKPYILEVKTYRFRGHSMSDLVSTEPEMKLLK